MKKAGKFLTFGLVIFSFSILCSAAHAQSVMGSEGKKHGATSGTAPARFQSNTNKATKSDVAGIQSDSKLNTASAHSVNPAATGKGTRNCQPKSISKPYSISRADFNKLPKDRQQFVLDNSNKYSIVD